MKLVCTGQSNGINVSLSTKSIHFGEVQVDANTNRLLNVVNSSDLATTFQFITDPNSPYPPEIIDWGS